MPSFFLKHACNCQRKHRGSNVTSCTAPGMDLTGVAKEYRYMYKKSWVWGRLSSLVEKPQPLETQHGYYIQLNREMGLLHIAELGSRVSARK